VTKRRVNFELELGDRRLIKMAWIVRPRRRTLGGRRDLAPPRQGHDAHAERTCNLALQPSLRREVIRLRELGRDFRLRVLSFFHQRGNVVPVLRLSQYHACITIAVWHFPLLERRGPRLERRGDPAGRARRRGRQCYRREVRILLCHARQGTASITAHVSASGKVPRPIIPSAAQGGAALLARRLHDNGLHEQRELGQSNMNCGLTKWFALLHDVKVRCGIERHDWALGPLHVPACQACDCCHFRPRNVVEGGIARTLLRVRIGEQGCSVGDRAVRNQEI
jgi:hypothetical protein